MIADTVIITDATAVMLAGFSHLKGEIADLDILERPPVEKLDLQDIVLLVAPELAAKHHNPGRHILKIHRAKNSVLLRESTVLLWNVKNGNAPR